MKIIKLVSEPAALGTSQKIYRRVHKGPKTASNLRHLNPVYTVTNL
jgi:hypothetical protein